MESEAVVRAMERGSGSGGGRAQGGLCVKKTKSKSYVVVGGFTLQVSTKLASGLVGLVGSPFNCSTATTLEIPIGAHRTAWTTGLMCDVHLHVSCSISCLRISLLHPRRDEDSC
jgi:hypothetical protein